MAASEQSMSEYVYQLKVTLNGSRPAIWRRFQVGGDTTLHRLHLILQVVMGWTNSHLYRFEIGGLQYGEPGPKIGFYRVQVKDSRRALLKTVASREKAKFIYEYDFGDSWKHEVVVERILPAGPETPYPVCLAGKRACPPEDCGGVWGYAELLEISHNPRHGKHAEVIEWPGEQFDPGKFDLDEVNQWLSGFGEENTLITKTKIGRNDPCPCGSGRKYKRCCSR